MRNTVSATDKARLTRPNEGRARPASLAQSIRNLARRREKPRAGATKNFAPNQETAFQPSGNGISGQADVLSLAAFGS
jgi:hypothetical protein